MAIYTQLNDTIVALATPAGIGAIGVIRLSGNDAIRISNDIFHGKDLTQQATHTLHLGTIRNEQGIPLDEVLLSLFVAPRSYTRENVVEISCHGSPYILQQVIQLCLRKGARLAQPGEFTLRAFLNGGLDLSQAEAVADLIASDSAAAHDLAIKQLRGGVSLEIKKLRDELIHFASMIELELDFGEEDVAFANRDELKALVEKVLGFIRALTQSFDLGNAIKSGVNTVIAGRPNAGKSTLLNILLNEERAIVSDIAGTTRDTIEEILNIKGVAFRLIDTAGIREATDTIEAIGITKTMEKVKAATILLYVADANELSIATIVEDLNTLAIDASEGRQALVLLNKIDKCTPSKLAQIKTDAETILGCPFLLISANESTFATSVKESIYQIGIGQGLQDNVIVSNARHLEALQNADEALQNVLYSLVNGISSDFVAMDIRRSLHYLSSILGDVSTEDLLENIFRNFCIGK